MEKENHVNITVQQIVSGTCWKKKDKNTKDSTNFMKYWGVYCKKDQIYEENSKIIYEIIFLKI